MREIIDHLGRAVTVSDAPQRIISLVPSQTELLFDLGVGPRVVGVTKFCIHPKAARKSAAVIGGTKQFDFDKIAGLTPELIIGNKEENFQSGIDRLAADFPVWMSDIITLADAQRMIHDVGALVNAEAQAHALNTEITASFATLPASAPRNAPRVLYLIWRTPWMGAGAGTFIHEMLRAAGLHNVLADHPRYPELTPADITAFQPDVILLSSEPYPFRQKHLLELAALCPQARIELVDGEPFSWYGSRLRHTPAYLHQLRARVG